MNTTSDYDGMLLVAHGARDPRWAEPFVAIALALRERHPRAVVELAYLELMAPDTESAGRALLAAGCRRLAVMPLLMGAGSHAREDLPKRLAALRALSDSAQWELLPTLGDLAPFRAAVVDLLSARLPGDAVPK